MPNNKTYKLNTAIMPNNKSYKLNATIMPNNKSFKLNTTMMPNNNEKHRCQKAPEIESFCNILIQSCNY